MAVYVDSLFVGAATDAQARRVGAKNGDRWCHLMADSLEELHEFARKIGLKRRWFQGDHYDLTPCRRIVAVRLGAQEVSSRKLVEIRRALRAKRECLGVLCTDDEHNVMADPAGADEVDDLFYGAAAGSGKSFDEKAWADPLAGLAKR